MIKPQWEILSDAHPSTPQEVMEILLGNRGVDASFINGTLADLEAHLCIRGMDEGAELLALHLFEGHNIVLVGDYDCDGITSVAQLALFFRDIGYDNFELVIPRRDEGYGLPERAVRDNPDCRLFVVMDCGTHDVKTVSMVRDLGADCIVIDHHETKGGEVAPATVLINPKQSSCPSGFKEMCASGITLLFLARLRRSIGGKFSVPRLGGKYLVLAAIGTIADIVPLIDANRILAKHGLACLNARDYKPVQRLIDSTRISTRNLNAGHIGFFVGPRLNAAGRMADPRIALDLLLAEGQGEIDRLAREIEVLNSKRQSKEESILRAARQRMDSMPAARRTSVVGDPGWHIGLTGIIASRIQQEFHYGPAVVLSVDDNDGIARGSARSVPGFDIHAALERCGTFLLKWGGHKMAAGLTLASDRIEAFAERFEAVACEEPGDVFVPRGKVDTEIDIDLVSPLLFSLLEQLEPHGAGNPSPTFLARQVEVTDIKTFGKEQSHLRLSFGKHVNGIFWKGNRHCPSLKRSAGSLVDIVFQVEWDDYRGRPVLNLKDIGRIR
jgi:single-stranded-DNA-specific exonuclease